MSDNGSDRAVNVAEYGQPWEPLSHGHQRMTETVASRLDGYADDRATTWAYVFVGTFGAGKTKVLFDTYKKSLDRGVLPMYITAAILFEQALTEQNTFTTEQLAGLAERKLQQFTSAICAGDSAAALAAIDPHRSIHADMRAQVPELVKVFRGRPASDVKVVMLVDELEAVYQQLQVACGNNNSPLQPWLETRTALKFLAIAPAGMYSMGGADRDRVERFNLPAVELEYIREKLLPDPGQANAAWWLSRGKPRQLFHAIHILRSNADRLGDPLAVDALLHSQLKPIGQPPAEVPAAMSSLIDSATKLPYLVNLQPVRTADTTLEERRYVIPVRQLRVGELVDQLVTELSVDRSVAMAIVRYLIETLRAVSDASQTAYIDDYDLPELIRLTLDHLLEYEHDAPNLQGKIGQVLRLYQLTETEPGQRELRHMLHRYSERTAWHLPLTIREIRRIFPFPTMNPTLSHDPVRMQEQWQGNAHPVWLWKEGAATYFYFAHRRAFQAFAETDSFLTDALPDGQTVCCFFAPGELPTEHSGVVRWLLEQRKLELHELNALVSHFLLSLSGEVDDTPANLYACLDATAKKFADNLLITRKLPLYQSALRDAVSGIAPTPARFCVGDPQLQADAQNAWGATRITNARIAVSGLALAFAPLSEDGRRLLAELRELFRRQANKTGPLRPGLRSSGQGTIVDDLLPRFEAGGTGMIHEPAMIQRLQQRWGPSEERALVRLADLIPVTAFQKIALDEDHRRVLEAFWSARRGQFGPLNLRTLRQKVTDASDTLREANQLAELARVRLNVGINFRNLEAHVTAHAAYAQLQKLLDQLDALGDRAEPAVCNAVTVVVEALEPGNLNTLREEVRRARRSIDQRGEKEENVRRNVSQGCPRAVAHCSLSEADVDRFLREQLTFEPDILDLQSLAIRTELQTGRLEGLNQVLLKVERMLQQIEDIVAEVRLI